MSKRKIILILGCAVLLCVYVAQTVVERKSALKAPVASQEVETIDAEE